MPGTIARSGGDRRTGSDTFPDDGVPAAPEYLTASESQVWHQLIGQLPDGLLRSIDGHRLAQLCRNIVDSQECHERYLKTRDIDYKESQAWLRACRQAEAEIGKLSAQFGLTPRDRQGIKFQPQVIDEAEAWADE